MRLLQSLIFMNLNFHVHFIILLFTISGLQNYQIKGASIKGHIIDENTHEPLPGTTIYIEKEKIYTIADGFGFYKITGLSVGTYELKTKGLGYENSQIQSITISSEKDIIEYDFYLKATSTAIDEVQVVSSQIKSTEQSARRTEQVASNIMNVISAKTIELSPDLNVANVVQRLSGITLDKSTTGIGQYAILRGMDKRYSYTLINGIKIPSTNSDHRYVPLDIFPSDLVDRIEVTKSLTPDMEGDAIAGVINLIMKNAPDRFMFNANFSVGYNQFWYDRSSYSYGYNNGWGDHTCETFNTIPINFKSPYELHYPTYVAHLPDFPTANLTPTIVSDPYNITAGLAIGNRFFKHRLGIVLAGSYQSAYKGTESLFFDTSPDQNVQRGKPLVTDINNRTYSALVVNYGFHNKLDFLFNNDHRLQLYTAYMIFVETRVRQTNNLDFQTNYSADDSTFNKTYETQLQYNLQNLFNMTLQGDHKLLHHLFMQWSAVYSLATNRTPDQATVLSDQEKDQEGKAYILQPIIIDAQNGLQDLWRRNSDQDKAGYLNFKYDAKLFGSPVEFSAGGLYRQKTRVSFYNAYTIIPNFRKFATYPADWTTYSNVPWNQVTQPTGDVAVAETFDAREDTKAVYGMFAYSSKHLQIKGGLRVESTLQGYHTLYIVAREPQNVDFTNTDFLPSIHFKYSPVENENFRLSYYRAINKPGFLEIVPCPIVGDDFTTIGNPNLRRAIADNFDFRWEFFPKGLDQIMVGLFYKNIKGAIENEFEPINSNQNDFYLTPENIPHAINYGLEIDLVKYLGNWGVKANYTYTNSSITTKVETHFTSVLGHDSIGYISEKRPLYGQAANVGNLSMMYRNEKLGIYGQLALTYTGDRIYAVSPYAYNDQWQKGFWQLDASAEKKITGRWTIFAKAHNLLNTHVIVYIKATDKLNSNKPDHSASDNTTLVRNDFSEPSYLLGFRCKFN